MAARDEQKLVLGKIVGLYGVEGWVKLESYSDPRTRIFKYSPWFVGSADASVEYANVKGRAQGKGIVARLPGVDSRDAAAALIGVEIRIARSALPKPKQGEYYWVDLEGLDVFNLEGVAFGKVSHLFSTGANDVLVVRDGERERLVPFVTEQFVKEVDIDGGRIVVDWDAEF
ncbi:ribosome maturation factor RimM [Rudaea sp.]|uniref:ribosome maturation factor RimM n=1 Tax=Rudaea sp. TaxID=2136325 RepID=UPI002ED2F2A6